MNDIEIIDNFLPKEEFEAVCDEFLSANFPWFYEADIIEYNNMKEPDGDEFQFIHGLYAYNKPNSPYFKVFEKYFMDKLPIFGLIRVKLNHNVKTKEHLFDDLWHIDMLTPEGKTFQGKTAIFYLNTNNGYTLFKDGTKVDCVANRMLIFPCELEHTGVSCTDKKRRVGLNINYTEIDKEFIPYKKHGN